MEWAALVLLVGALLAALLATGIVPSVADAVGCSVSKIFRQAGSCSAPTARPNPGSRDPWNSPNPVTRATWGTYVSLGDSYSAGEGLGDYQPGSHVEKSRCRVGLPFGGPCIYHQDPQVIVGCDRSAHAYNATVSGTYDFQGGKRTWACSGSITKDIYDGPNDPRCMHGRASGPAGEGCQVDRVNANTSLVTMTIGGNDAGFANDLSSCYMDRAKLAFSSPCSDQGPKIDNLIAAIPQNLEADLKAIRARAPHARIIILTYPRPFPADPQHNTGCVLYNVCLTPADQTFFNREATKLDDTICAAVHAAGVGGECVNGYNAFATCEMGMPNSCLQAPATHISGSKGIGVNPGAFHPTARGQQLMADLIDQEIADPPPGVGGG